MFQFSLAFILVLSVLPELINCYKPVVIVHGILSGNSSMLTMADRIKEKHPGTIIYATDKFSGWSSLHPIWYQILELGKDMKEIMGNHSEGIHLIGYSQGGLVARGILSQFPDHNVNTFVSLSSPQCGQYGTQFLHLFFPTLACEEAYELFYSAVGQHTSVGNYWNDPHHQKLFFEYSAFLPFVNNLIVTNTSSEFKRGVTSLRKMILIGGPDDEVITPWQSSHFGCFNENETVVDYQDQGFFKNDSFGLKTLSDRGKLKIFELSGNLHLEWHTNLTVIDNYILPFLD